MRPQRIVACLLGGLALFAVVSPRGAISQLIQIRPGYVRAPFVRVYTDPYGGSHVRAPFVSVTSPGYYPRRSFRPRYRAPSAYAPVTPGDPTMAPRPGESPLGSTVVDDSLDVDGQRRSLLVAADSLNRQLARLRAGSGWSDYLRIQLRDPDSRVTQSMVDGEDVLPANSETEREMLLQLRTRFENVLDNPEYQVIARLPGFQGAYQQLARYLELTEESDQDVAPQSLEEVELLPEPRAAKAAPREEAPREVTPAGRPLPGEPTPADPRTQ